MCQYYSVYPALCTYIWGIRCLGENTNNSSPTDTPGQYEYIMLRTKLKKWPPKDMVVAHSSRVYRCTDHSWFVARSPWPLYKSFSDSCYTALIGQGVPVFYLVRAKRGGAPLAVIKITTIYHPFLINRNLIILYRAFSFRRRDRNCSKIPFIKEDLVRL